MNTARTSLTTFAAPGQRVAGRRLATATAVLALIVSACSGGSFADDPKAYIPTEVDGEKVSKESAFVDQITQQFQGQESVDEVAVAAIGGAKDLENVPQPDEGQPPDLSDLLPSLVLLAARTTDPEASLDEVFAEGNKEEVKSATIEGTDVRFIEAGEGETKISFALAQPKKDIQLIAFSFVGGQEETEKGITAMLKAGK